MIPEHVKANSDSISMEFTKVENSEVLMKKEKERKENKQVDERCDRNYLELTLLISVNVNPQKEKYKNIPFHIDILLLLLETQVTGFCCRNNGGN